MGLSHSAFTSKELDEYQALTFLSKQDIIRLYEKFEALDPERVSGINSRVPFDKIASMIELKANPFCGRICKVFASSSEELMSFEDFLNMASVFSVEAPNILKMDYAFRIYDFDDDGLISKSDLNELIHRIIGDKKLSEAKMNQLIENVIQEADLDEDGALSYPEFEHVITKSPDFFSSFDIRL